MESFGERAPDDGSCAGLEPRFLLAGRQADFRIHRQEQFRFDGKGGELVFRILIHAAKPCLVGYRRDPRNPRDSRLIGVRQKLDKRNAVVHDQAIGVCHIHAAPERKLERA